MPWACMHRSIQQKQQGAAAQVKDSISTTSMEGARPGGWQLSNSSPQQPLAGQGNNSRQGRR